jgi:hypothetical protein
MVISYLLHGGLGQGLGFKKGFCGFKKGFAGLKGLKIRGLQV